LYEKALFDADHTLSGQKNGKRTVIKCLLDRIILYGEYP